jgi:hypothetical protein
MQENCKTAHLNSAKKKKRNFVGQKYFNLYFLYRLFGASFSSVENSDYWISPKCVSFPRQWLLSTLPQNTGETAPQNVYFFRCIKRAVIFLINLINWFGNTHWISLTVYITQIFVCFSHRFCFNSSTQDLCEFLQSIYKRILYHTHQDSYKSLKFPCWSCTENIAYSLVLKQGITPFFRNQNHIFNQCSLSNFHVYLSIWLETNIISTAFLPTNIFCLFCKLVFIEKICWYYLCKMCVHKFLILLK